MPLAPAQWQKALAADSLAPVYLLAGEELLVLEAADALRARARELGYAEREVLEVEQRFDWDDLARAAAGMSLFASRRLLDLRLPTGRPGVDGAKAIGEFCADPPPDVTLLITAMEWSSKHDGAWSRKLDAAGVMVVFNAPRPNEWAAWIGARLASRGLSATPDAAALLAERVEGNLLAAAQEVDKLALLDDGRPLDAARMEQLIAESARFDVFGLVDAALNGKPAQVARMLAGLHAEGEAVPALMGMVTMELQRAAALAQTKARGGNLAAEFRAQRVWDSKQAAYTRALARHDAMQWERFVAEAGRVDRIAKGRAPGDAWRQLERLLLAVADPKARRMLAA